jgi:hypothetical protein
MTSHIHFQAYERNYFKINKCDIVFIQNFEEFNNICTFIVKLDIPIHYDHDIYVTNLEQILITKYKFH